MPPCALCGTTRYLDGCPQHNPKLNKATIHNLFNELHRRLQDEILNHPDNDDPRMLVLADLANKVDELHHTYTDIQDPNWKIVSAGVRPYPE